MSDNEKLADWREWLEAEACEIDEDWAADRQEGGNAPMPRNIPAEILAALSQQRLDPMRQIVERLRRDADDAGDCASAYLLHGVANDIQRALKETNDG